MSGLTPFRTDPFLTPFLFDEPNERVERAEVHTRDDEPGADRVRGANEHWLHRAVPDEHQFGTVEQRDEHQRAIIDADGAGDGAVSTPRPRRFYRIVTPPVP